MGVGVTGWEIIAIVLAVFGLLGWIGAFANADRVANWRWRGPHEVNYAAIQALCEEWKLACSDDECRCAVIEAGWRIGYSNAQEERS